MSYHSAALICYFERIDEAEQLCDILWSKPVLVSMVEVCLRKPPQLVDLLDTEGIAQRSRVSQQTGVQLTHQLPLHLERQYLFWDFISP